MPARHRLDKAWDRARDKARLEARVVRLLLLCLARTRLARWRSP